MSPGTIVRCGAVTMRWIPSSSMVPHDGFGGRTPAPRNDSAASSRIALATISGKKTTIVETRLGRISENMIRSGPAPCARAASTNSFSRSASTWPRSGRAMYGT